MCSRSRPMTFQPMPFGISARIRIEQKGDDGVRAHRLEEILAAGRVAERGRAARAFFRRRSARISSCCSGVARGKFIDRWEKFVGARGEVGKSFAIIVLLLDGERGQRLIDEIDDAGLVRARRVRRSE